MDVVRLRIRVSKHPPYRGLLKVCYRHARRSDHPSTHNAALLVRGGKIVLKGVNVLPSGVKARKSRFRGGNKHIYPNHAERDVIYRAARCGLKTGGLTMVMPWLPCIQCANAIISCGIRKLIVHRQMVKRTKAHWRVELTNAAELMREAGVEIVAYDGVVGEKAYMHGKKWDA